MDLNNYSNEENKKQTKRRRINQNPEETSEVDNASSQPVNIAIRNEHPLLNPFILETVLIFCKGHQSFLSLRLVCKLWDIELCKILRPQIEIPLTRLINIYPEGLGCEWNQSEESNGYQYQSPYSDTPEFQNIKVIVTTCKDIRDSKVINWFKFMGSQVKSLHYSCALNCYHQNAFLRNCVETWCPNLEILHLSEIQCFASLIYILEGREQKERIFEKEGLNCTKLRSVIISVDSDDPLGQFTRCGARNSLVVSSSRHEDILARARIVDDDWLDNYFRERELESGEPLNQLIEKKFDEIPKNFFEQVIFAKYLNSDGYFQRSKVDWGIMGLILREAPLKKIIVKRLDGKLQCRDFALFLLYQPSTLKVTLEHLEFRDNVFVGRDPICLKILSLFKFPLKYLRLDNFLPFRESKVYFNDLLESCAETLNTLEIDTPQYQLWLEEFIAPKFEIPMLPNLKKFVHRNIAMFFVKGNELFRNCPKLEICKFLGKVDRDEYLSNCSRRALRWFFKDLEVVTELRHSLKELKICECLKLENIEQLGQALRNLIKVELWMVGQYQLDYLFEEMGTGKGKIEDLSVVITNSAYEWGERFTEHLGKIKVLTNIAGLKFLEIDFQVDKVFLSLNAFREGFAKVEGLTSLTIKNFGIMKYDQKEIERNVEHIPYVDFTGMQTYSGARLLKRSMRHGYLVIW